MPKNIYQRRQKLSQSIQHTNCSQLFTQPKKISQSLSLFTRRELGLLNRNSFQKNALTKFSEKLETQFHETLFKAEQAFDNERALKNDLDDLHQLSELTSIIPKTKNASVYGSYLCFKAVIDYFNAKNQNDFKENSLEIKKQFIHSLELASEHGIGSSSLFLSLLYLNTETTRSFIIYKIKQPETLSIYRQYEIETSEFENLIEQNNQKAADYLLLASNQNNLDALLCVGMMYLPSIEGVAYDPIMQIECNPEHRNELKAINYFVKAELAERKLGPSNEGTAVKILFKLIKHQNSMLALNACIWLAHTLGREEIQQSIFQLNKIRKGEDEGLKEYAIAPSIRRLYTLQNEDLPDAMLAIIDEFFEGYELDQETSNRLTIRM